MEPMRNLERGLELTLAASMLLAACGPQEGAKTPDPSKIDQLIPSPTAEAPLFDENDRTESVEIYQSERLNACAFHPFDQNKLALEPLVAVNCEVEVGTNSLTVGGSLMNPNPGMASLYENPDGSSGYTVTTQMKVTEVEQWMSEADLSEAEEAQVAKAIEQTRKTDGIVDVTLSTKLNVAKGPDGKDRLVNMGLSVILATDEAATSAALNDTLKPLTESDLLGSQQIAGVDFVPKTNGEWKATLTTYPADWVEVGDSTFVSPEFVALQEKVAAAGERYTLTPQGTIEDQTDQGVTVLPGIKATPEGTITLATKEGNITLPANSIIFDESGVLTVEGYEYADGVWQKVVAQATETAPEVIAPETLELKLNDGTTAEVPVIRLEEGVDEAELTLLVMDYVSRDVLWKNGNLAERMKSIDEFGNPSNPNGVIGNSFRPMLKKLDGRGKGFDGVRTVLPLSEVVDDGKQPPRDYFAIRMDQIESEQLTGVILIYQDAAGNDQILFVEVDYYTFVNTAKNEFHGAPPAAATATP